MSKRKFIFFFEGALAQNVGNCNFENPSGLCGYTQDKTDDFDWWRYNGGTASSGTGPSSDHTTLTGLKVPGIRLSSPLGTLVYNTLLLAFEFVL